MCRWLVPKHLLKIVHFLDYYSFFKSFFILLLSNFDPSSYITMIHWAIAVHPFSYICPLGVREREECVMIWMRGNEEYLGGRGVSIWCKCEGECWRWGSEGWVLWEGCRVWPVIHMLSIFFLKLGVHYHKTLLKKIN